MNKAIESDGEGYSFIGMSIGYYLLYVAVALLIAGGIIVLVAKARDDDSSWEEDSNNEIRNDYIEKTMGEPVEKIVNEIPEQDNVRRVFEDNNIDDIPSEQSTAVDITAPVLNNRSELESIEMIKKYKELLDLGILNQDEFDKKKRELLNL